jgi:hypothetical protein
VGILRVMVRCCKHSSVRKRSLITYKAPIILRKIVALPNDQLEFYGLQLYKVALRVDASCCHLQRVHAPLALWPSLFGSLLASQSAAWSVPDCMIGCHLRPCGFSPLLPFVPLCPCACVLVAVSSCGRVLVRGQMMACLLGRKWKASNCHLLSLMFLTLPPGAF